MAELSTDEIRENLENQVSALKEEMAKMKKRFASRGADALGEAADSLNGFQDTAHDAARQFRQQAHAVGDAIRENPGTAATVLSSAGVLGFLLGIVVGALAAGNSRRL